MRLGHGSNERDDGGREGSLWAATLVIPTWPLTEVTGSVVPKGLILEDE